MHSDGTNQNKIRLRTHYTTLPIAILVGLGKVSGWLAGVSRGPKSNQKNIVLNKKYKDDQNGLIQSEN